MTHAQLSLGSRGDLSPGWAGHTAWETLAFIAPFRVALEVSSLPLTSHRRKLRPQGSPACPGHAPPLLLPQYIWVQGGAGGLLCSSRPDSHPVTGLRGTPLGERPGGSVLLSSW